MRAVVQRVGWAEVEVSQKVVARIERGLLVYIGVASDDGEADAELMAQKVANLRIFEDKDDKLNLSVQDVRGGVLAVPNFTLMADTRKGRRPALTDAAAPEVSRPLYERFVAALAKCECRVVGGVFGACMNIRSAADGPVNIILETPRPGELRDNSQEVNR